MQKKEEKKCIHAQTVLNKLTNSKMLKRKTFFRKYSSQISLESIIFHIYINYIVSIFYF